MFKRTLALLLSLVMLMLLLPAAAFAEEDYITVTIQKGDTVRKLLKANGRDYDVDKYVVMVLNGMDRESQMEILTIGETIKIPKAEKDIEGDAPISLSFNLKWRRISFAIGSKSLHAFAFCEVLRIFINFFSNFSYFSILFLIFIIKLFLFCKNN